MSFLSVIKTIGADIELGIQAAEPIIAGFVPAAGPILLEVASVISALEQNGKVLSPAQVSSTVQILANANAVKQASQASGSSVGAPASGG